MIDHLDTEFLDGAGDELAVEHRAKHLDHPCRLVGASLVLVQALVQFFDLHGDLVERNLGELEQDEDLGPEPE